MGAIIRFTFREALRRRLVLAVGVLTAIFLCLYAVFVHFVAAHVAGNPLQAAANGAGEAMVGIYLARSFSGLLAILVAVGALSSEIENGSMQSILVRPVRRWGVVAGKYLGYAAMLVLYTLALQGAVMLIAWALTGMGLHRPVEVLGLLCLEPLVLLALTLLGSAALPTLANGAAVVLLYGLCVIAGFVEQVGVLSGLRGLVEAGIVVSLILPADAMYRKAFSVVSAQMHNSLLAQFMGPLGTLAAPSWGMVIYGGAYALGMVALAVWVFSRRDV